MFSDVRVKCVVRPHRYHVRRRGLYVGQAFFPSTAANTRAITRRPPSGREKLRGHSLAWMAAQRRYDDATVCPPPEHSACWLLSRVRGAALLLSLGRPTREKKKELQL